MTTQSSRHFSDLWTELSQGVFPWIDDCFWKLDENHKLFMAVCEAVIEAKEFDYAKWKGNGRPPISRLRAFKAFLFKAVLNLATTKELVRVLREEPLSRRLCGWDSPGHVPSESWFSRRFGEFAQRGFTEDWFEKLVITYRDDVDAETISYDSAPIEVRAHAENARRRQKELEPDQPDPPSRLDIQPLQDARTNLDELPVACEWGCKRDSHGKKKQWKGGKLHVGVTRDGFPVAVKYTSASLHDSQALIPLAQLASARMPHQFDLADAAYDAKQIRSACADLGTVAIIDANPRRNADASGSGMNEREQEIYKDRTAAERYFSHHLEAHGGRTVRVRTPAKIAFHLLLGTIVIAVEQLIRLTC